MEKDFDIEIINEEANEAGSVQLPLNFLSFGEIEVDDIKVYIKQSVYKELEKYASSDTSKELGTILIGDYCEQMGKTHVVISDYIEAKYTDASASTLTFTHETWDYVHKQHEKLYSGKKIIGWQHTHPNYGIFLSNYDLFIQENFFNMPFQIAYVIDPIQNIRGFFQWKNNKIEKLKGYYVYDDVGKPIKIEQIKTEKKVSAGGAKAGKLMTAVVALLCVFSVVLGIFAFNLNRKYNEQLEMQENINQLINKQEEVIADQKQNIDDLQSQLISGIIDSSGVTSAQELINKIENGELNIENKDDVLTQLKALVAGSQESDTSPEETNTVVFKSYTVKSGDNLSGICAEYGIDYEANKNIVLSLNGISDADSIQVGQTIVLPVS